MNARDKQSHFPFDYLVLFVFKTHPVKKALVNAKDEANAIKKAVNRFIRVYPNDVITCVRIGGVYPNKKKTVVINKDA